MHMPPPSPSFKGKYRLVSWNEPACPVPPEEKGLRYLLTHLTSFKRDVELELKVGQLSEGSWPLEGSLRVSPSQRFSVKASVPAARPIDAEGMLFGNKRRDAWFSARQQSERLELSIGYRDAHQAPTPVQAFSFKAEAPSQPETPAKPVVDPAAALAETWTARLRGTRISYVRDNDFQRDYSGGSFYWHSGWDIYLRDNATFEFREGARTLAGRWGVVARNRNIYLELTSTEESLSYRIKRDGSYLTLNSLVCSWSRLA